MSEYLFTDDKGTLIHPDTFSKRLRKIYDSISYPKEFHLHTLRHYFVTAMLHSGVDKQTVAELAGHGDTTFLERTYCHPQTLANTAIYGLNTCMNKSHSDIVNCYLLASWHGTVPKLSKPLSTWQNGYEGSILNDILPQRRGLERIQAFEQTQMIADEIVLHDIVYI